MAEKLYSGEEINAVFNAHIDNKLFFNKVSIDSREISNKDIFFAIKGEKDDGHKYVKNVLKNKNNLAIVSKRINNKKIIKIKNTLEGLRDLASYARQRTDAKIIAITGSCGKTSLKNLLNISLRRFGKTHCSPKSYNNHIGVPYSLANLSSDNKYGIFEIGMSAKGEIDNLVSLVKPHIGIITNIGPAHLENFDNIFGICKAKSEIMNGIYQNGVIILNKDDEFFNTLMRIAKKKKIKVLTFGFLKSDVQIKKKSKKVFFKINNKIFNFKIRNFNKSSLYNIAATLCVHYYLNNNIIFLKNIFNNFRVPEGRGNEKYIKIKNKKILLINDSYNSNPVSLNEAIHNFSLRKKKNNQRKVLVIGDMLELGIKSKYYHEQSAKMLNKTNIDKVHCVGSMMRYAHQKLNLTKRGLLFRDIRSFKENIFNLLENNDILLVKSSNRVGLFNFFKKF
jgi:UDP-N-acetylmuramoyl-tripeptide--D-alanyl-D-alanine ligase